MIFRIRFTDKETWRNISNWLIANLEDTDYTLHPFQGSMLIEFTDERLATMFKLIWHHTIVLLKKDPR
jgi:hypothetical protein